MNAGSIFVEDEIEKIVVLDAPLPVSKQLESIIVAREQKTFVVQNENGAGNGVEKRLEYAIRMPRQPLRFDLFGDIVSNDQKPGDIAFR